LKKRKEEGQLLARRFSTVVIALDSRVQKFDVEQEESFAEVWNKHKEIYPDDINNENISLRQYSVKDEELFLRVRRSRFVAHLATQPKRPSRLIVTNRLLDNDYCLAVSVGAVAVTRDNYIVFCQRTGTAFNPGEYTLPPGGYLDIDDIFRNDGKNFLSLEKGIKREYREELRGLDYQFGVKTLGLVYSRIGSRQPLIAVETKIPHTRDEAESLLKSADQDWEMGEFHFIRADMDSLRNFVQSHHLCTHDVWKLALWVSKNL
jgi:hypothetical protein